MSGCARARRAGLAAIAGTLSEAELLDLEAHLGACTRCAEEQARLRLFEILAEREPPTLSPQARARVLARVLETVDAQEMPAPARPARRLVWAIAAALAAAALTGLFALSWRDRSETRRIAETGEVEAPPRSPGPRVLAFGSARVEPSADAQVAWIAETETLSIRSGRVHVSVPDGGRSIRVATERFVVVALASTFVVDPGGVRSELGWVRVEDPSGEELARLGAGEKWRVDAAPPAPCGECAGLIRQAAAKLARGGVAEARGILQDVLDRRPSAAQTAEARLLLADAARIDGDRAEALRRYLHVARTSRGAVGENALYAAAQLEAESGRGDAARSLFGQYLDRYPNGRFASEARRRLAGTGR